MLISTKQAAAILDVDARTVQRRAESGEIPATKLPGKRGSYVFDEAAILAEKDKTPADAPTSPPPGDVGAVDAA